MSGISSTWTCLPAANLLKSGGSNVATLVQPSRWQHRPASPCEVDAFSENWSCGRSDSSMLPKAFAPEAGGWFNIKTPSYQYRKSHCGDKTILRPSYLHNGISFTGKMASLYWIRAQVSRTGISNYISQFIVGCNCSMNGLDSLPASGSKLLMYMNGRLYRKWLRRIKWCLCVVNNGQMNAC